MRTLYWQEAWVEENGKKQQNEAVQEKNKLSRARKVNSDIVGWIKVSSTKIDYPILQGKDNKYYLHRNYRQEKSKAGSIFMDYRNNPAGENFNMILYGHRMKDGTMFADLKKLLREDFYIKKPEIYVETLGKTYRGEVFSVYLTTTGFNYIETDFANEEEYLQFLKTLQKRSVFWQDAELTPDTQILTLSTCDFALDSEKGRLVVHAVLTEI